MEGWPSGGLTADYIKQVLKLHAGQDTEPYPKNYRLHYKALSNWFSHRQNWSVDDVFLGCLAVYGWMPTILEGRTPVKGLLSANKAKEIADLLTKSDWEKIPVDFVNRSVVGTSKFLHFWRPQYFSIWDSRVRDALVGACPVRKAQDEVKEYYSAMRELHPRVDDKKRAKSMRKTELKLFRIGKTKSEERQQRKDGN